MTIIYFSATGNSKYVAKRISKENDKLLFIPDLIKENNYEFKDEVIGIVTPTYFWGLPSIVKEFLSKVSLHCDYLFFISTYGTTPGASKEIANKLIKGKNIDFCYGIGMVDTYTPIFDISTKKKQDKFTKHSEEQLNYAIKCIYERKHNKRMKRQVPALITNTISQPLYDSKKRLTSRFTVNNNCIGCSLCAKKCPVNAIEIVDKKPVWVKNKCVMCLGCLHRCPKFAIECGKNTKKHGQYQNSKARV